MRYTTNRNVCGHAIRYVRICFALACCNPHTGSSCSGLEQINRNSVVGKESNVLCTYSIGGWQLEDEFRSSRSHVFRAKTCVAPARRPFRLQARGSRVDADVHLDPQRTGPGRGRQAQDQLWRADRFGDQPRGVHRRRQRRHAGPARLQIRHRRSFRTA